MQDLQPRTAPVSAVRKSTWAMLGLIILASGLLSYLILNHGHSWGDDFAAYIMQARSLLQGSMDEFVQHSAFTMDNSWYRLGPITTPWGLPLMLAPVYALFGMNFLALKLVLTASYLSFLLSFFFLARTRLTDSESLLLTAFLAFNSWMLRAQNEIWPDLPFLMWSTLSLWLIERHINTESPSPPPWAPSLGIGLTIFMAAFTRTNGVLLLVPLAVAQLLRWKSMRAAAGGLPRLLPRVIAPYIVFGVLFGLQALLLPSRGGGLPRALSVISPQLVLRHVAYYFLVTGELLKNSGIGGFVLYAVLLVFFFTRLRTLRRRDAPLLLYMLSTLALFAFFPGIQGPRYIYPVLPIFFLLAFEGMKEVVARLSPGHHPRGLLALRLFWGALAVLSLVASAREARTNLAAHAEAPAGPLTPASSAMLDFVRRSTPDDSVIIFYKPRAMRLFTDRDSFLTRSCDDLPRGDYLVIMDDTEGGPDYNQIPPSQLSDCTSVALTPVFDRDGIVVYQISPPP